MVLKKRVAMVSFSISRAAVLALATATLVAGCSEQQRALPGSSVQTLNVEGKPIQVRISPFGGPGEYRLVAARAAILLGSPDAENELRRSQHAAEYYMKQTCVQRGYQVIEAGMLDAINYFARFRCNG
jgi:hypothetical protein